MWEVICGRHPRGQRVRQIRAIRVLTTVLTVFGTASVLNAGVYSFQWERPEGFDGSAGPFLAKDDAGLLNSLTLSYDSDAQRLTFLAAFEASPSKSNKPFGLTMVLNNGPDATGSTNKYAILRFFTGDETRDPAISAFVSKGTVNKNNQWFHKRSDRIATSRSDPSWVNALSSVDSVAGRVVLFDIDVTAINGFTPTGGNPADWFGVGFDDKIGMWMNAYALDLPTNAGSAIQPIQSRQYGWLWGPRANVDSGLFSFNDHATAVSIPEPASLMLMMGGAVAVCRRGKRVA